MPTVLTFRDFPFRAQHALEGHSASAAHPHWHTYVVRFWFAKPHDQDWLAEWLEREFARYHGANLNLYGDSSDEAIAVRFLEMTSDLGCVRVRVTNDGQRGAEVTS